MKVKVGVFFGGQSVEHEVSIISAVQAMRNFNTERYDIIPVYIARDNNMYTGTALLDISEYTKPTELLKKCQRVILVNNGGKLQLERYPKRLFGNNICDTIEVAFPVVHGTNVEDGCLQGYFKTVGIPYAGCDVLSSALGMDKYAMKCVLKDNGLPVLDCKRFNIKQYQKNGRGVMDEIEGSFSYPVIVKPIDLGSSVGIKKASDRKSLEEAIDYAFQFAKSILVERAIENLREINCAVLGDYEEAIASECEEPVNTDEILSYSDKYINGGKNGGSKGMASTKRKLPAEISDKTRKYIRELAVNTFQSLGCSGVSRVDFLMDAQTEEIWVNEINTIPGSLSFYLWEPIGIAYESLLDRVVKLALKRARENMDIVYTIDTNILSGANISGVKSGFSKLGQ